MTTLLAYPNVSEGRDRATIDRIAAAFGDALLDVHSDVDHHRTRRLCLRAGLEYLQLHLQQRSSGKREYRILFRVH